MHFYFVPHQRRERQRDRECARHNLAPHELDERILDVIDLEALIVFQSQLYTSLCECDVTEKEAEQRSRAMIRDALSRLANDFAEDGDGNIAATPD